MRVLFSTTAGAGHFGPMIPLAQACVQAGWEVAVAAADGFAASVGAAGLQHLPFGEPARADLGAVFGRLPHLPHGDAERLVISEVFGRLDAQAALPRLTALMSEWHPDLVVREPFEFASVAAAEAAGVPQVQVATGMARLGGSFVGVVGEAMATLDGLAGLRAGRSAELLTESATLTTVPERMDAADRALTDDPVVSDVEPGPAWRYRFDAPASPRLPEPWGAPEQPLVYVSFGSVAATAGPFGGVYPKVIAALADIPVRALLTTGSDLDPAVLGPVPSNVHLERWWPQADVMGAAAAVVGHGGFGTTMIALAYGVPQVVVPLFASDQYIHAERAEAAGLAIRMLGGENALTGLPDALHRVLVDPAYRLAAHEVAREMAVLPDIARHLPALAGLTR